MYVLTGLNMLDGRCSKLDFFENEWLSIDGFSFATSLSVCEREKLALLFLRGVAFKPADDDRFIGFTLEMPKRIYKYFGNMKLCHRIMEKD